MQGTALVPFLLSQILGLGVAVAKTTNRLPNGVLTTYSGTPSDIMEHLTKEVADVLENAGVMPTGVHLLAMVHLVAGMIKSEMESPSARLGKMPTFKLLVSVLARNLTNTPYSPEETASFNEEFKGMVESLGGFTVAATGAPAPPKQEVFMAPMSKEVH